MIKRFCKQVFAKCQCPQNELRLIGTFRGRPRYYCDKCKEEVINFPWSAQTPYEQDNSLPSPSIMDGSN